MTLLSSVRKAVICKHEMVEDELFANGAITMLEGSGKDVVEGTLGEVTRFTCKKCGAVDYQPKIPHPPR